MAGCVASVALVTVMSAYDAGTERRPSIRTARDQLGQFRFAVLQRAGARRAARADLLRPDDHLRHARRPQPRAWRHVHARRLCRLARLQLHGLLHRRGHRRLAVRHAGRRRDGAGHHSPFLRAAARGPAARHLRPRHRLRRSGRFFFGSLSKTVPAPPPLVGITHLGFMFYPTYRLALLGIVAVALLRCSTSCSTAPASA